MSKKKTRERAIRRMLGQRPHDWAMHFESVLPQPTGSQPRIRMWKCRRCEAKTLKIFESLTKTCAEEMARLITES